MKTATATATATALTMVTSTTSKRPPQLLGLVFVILINTSASSFADEIKLSDLRPNGSNIVLPPLPPPPPPRPTINVVPIPALTNQQPNQVFIQYQNPASGVSAGAHIWNHSPSGQSGGNARITFPLP